MPMIITQPHMTDFVWLKPKKSSPNDKKAKMPIMSVGIINFHNFHCVVDSTNITFSVSTNIICYFLQSYKEILYLCIVFRDNVWK